MSSSFYWGGRLLVVMVIGAAAVLGMGRMPADSKPASAAGMGTDRLQILQPADGSQVVSEIAWTAAWNGQPGDWLREELYGADGRLLTRRLTRWGNPENGSGVITGALQFEIPGATEQGWLRLVILDDHQRQMSVDSTALTLQSKGPGKVQTAAVLPADITIQQPQAQPETSGGIVQVRGVVGPGVNLPLRVQLIDNSGRIVGHRLAGKMAGSRGQTVFEAQVPYQVRQRTAVRLVVFAEGLGLRQMLHLASLEIVLLP